MNGGGTSAYGRWKRRVRFLLIELAVCLAACEITIRIAAHFSRPLRGFMNLSYGGAMHWKRYAGATNLRELLEAAPMPYWKSCESYCGYVLNSRGLRTPEYDTVKEAGQRRIVLIGDSFLVVPSGPGDRFNISNCLHREMERAGRTVEVIDLGVEDTGPRFYLRMLELEASRLQADCTVVFLFVGNDLTDEAVEAGFLTFGETLRSWSQTLRFFHAAGELATKVPLTSLSSWVSPLVPARFQRGGFYRGGGCWTDEVPTFTEEAWFDIQRTRSAVFEEPWAPAIQLQWQAMTGIIARMKEVAEAGNSPFLLVLIPDATQVSIPLQSRIREAKPAVRMDFDRPQRELREFCNRHGIATIDLLPAFRAASSRGIPVYRFQDTHWNSCGQALAARAIAPVIRRIASRYR